jgi:hypothetical protein
MRRALGALSIAVALIAGRLVFGSNRAEATVTAPPFGQATQIHQSDPYEGSYGYGYPYDGYGWAPYWAWGGWGHRWGAGAATTSHRSCRRKAALTPSCSGAGRLMPDRAHHQRRGATSRQADFLIDT